jgi:hypothetical protein
MPEEDRRGQLFGDQVVEIEHKFTVAFFSTGLQSVEMKVNKRTPKNENFGSSAG